MAKHEKGPAQQTQTLRQSIWIYLENEPSTAKQLSGLVGISETDVVTHLEHIQLSAKNTDHRFCIEPAECIACEYVFENRRRLSTPSSCPECRSNRIEPPVFSLVPIESLRIE